MPAGTVTPAFPTSVATDQLLGVFSNFQSSQLTSAITSTQTVINVSSTTGWLVNMYASLVGPNGSEVVQVTNVNAGANQLTITRAMDGTGATPGSVGYAHNANQSLKQIIPAQILNQMRVEMEAIETQLAANTYLHGLTVKPLGTETALTLDLQDQAATTGTKFMSFKVAGVEKGAAVWNATNNTIDFTNFNLALGQSANLYIDDNNSLFMGTSGVTGIKYNTTSSKTEVSGTSLSFLNPIQFASGAGVAPDLSLSRLLGSEPAAAFNFGGAPVTNTDPKGNYDVIVYKSGSNFIARTNAGVLVSSNATLDTVLAAATTQVSTSGGTIFLDIGAGSLTVGAWSIPSATSGRISIAGNGPGQTVITQTVAGANGITIADGALVDLKRLKIVLPSSGSTGHGIHSGSTNNIGVQHSTFEDLEVLNCDTTHYAYHFVNPFFNKFRGLRANNIANGLYFGQDHATNNNGNNVVEGLTITGNVGGGTGQSLLTAVLIESITGNMNLNVFSGLFIFDNGNSGTYAGDGSIGVWLKGNTRYNTFLMSDIENVDVGIQVDDSNNSFFGGLVRASGFTSAAVYCKVTSRGNTFNGLTVNNLNGFHSGVGVRDDNNVGSGPNTFYNVRINSAVAWTNVYTLTANTLFSGVADSGGTQVYNQLPGKMLAGIDMNTHSISNVTTLLLKNQGAGTDANFNLNSGANNVILTGGLIINPSNTTPTQSFALTGTALGSAGTRNSHFFIQEGYSFDTLSHTVDWRMRVSPTTNAGASQYEWASNVDGGAFGTRMTLSDTGTIGSVVNLAPGADFTITQNSVTPFKSVNAGAVANTLVLSSGLVGIGMTPTTRNLEIGGTTPVIRLQDSGVSQKRLELYVDNTGLGTIDVPQSASSLRFSTISVEAMRINSSQKVSIGSSTAPTGIVGIFTAATSATVKQSLDLLNPVAAANGNGVGMTFQDGTQNLASIWGVSTAADSSTSTLNLRASTSNSFTSPQLSITSAGLVSVTGTFSVSSTSAFNGATVSSQKGLRLGGSITTTGGQGFVSEVSFTASGSSATLDHFAVQNPTFSAGGQTNVVGEGFLSDLSAATWTLAAGTFQASYGMRIIGSTSANIASAYGLHITGPTNATSTNIALMVASGATSLGGTLAVTGTSTFTGAVALNGGITQTTDLILNQNSVNVFRSSNSGAVANTLYLDTGHVGFGAQPASQSILDVQGSATYVNAIIQGMNVRSTLTLAGSAGNAAAGINIKPTFNFAGATGSIAAGVFVDGTAWTAQNLGSGSTGYAAYLAAPTAFATNYALYVASGTSSFNGSVILGNAVAVQLKDSGGTAQNVLYCSAGNDTFLQAASNSGDIRFTNVGGSVERFRINTTAPTSGNTAVWVSYHNGTSVVIQQASLGAADSGGTGFKLLRVPN